MGNRVYLCIDLKSFYASVECVERGLDPLRADLVVADPERGDKTICLAVSPSLKAKGVRNRCRLFEIPDGLEYAVASPRMKKYIDYSAEVYGIYLNYFSPDDIHVYSIDEVFIDATAYLRLYGVEPRGLAERLLAELERRLGLPAACGIGTNLYLAKIALDITAKHSEGGIGVLDERAYRESLWGHEPLTDFWRVGEGVAKRLAEIGITTMSGVAHCGEDALYNMFGVDAELLIDHAWGRESATIADIKSYEPKSSSHSSGQVLMRDYSFEEAEVVLKEMLGEVCLKLAKSNQLAHSVTLGVKYSSSYGGESENATAAFGMPTNAEAVVIPSVVGLYERVIDRDRKIKRITLSCNNVVDDVGARQMSMFDKAGPDRERKLQDAVISIKERFGDNSVLKGLDLQGCATGMERNRQIGGHKSGL